MYRRRRPHGPRFFGPTPIVEEPKVATKKQRCSGCHGFITPGENCLRLMLRKQFRLPCTICGTEPRRSKWYHLACKPVDLNKAMGYNPNGQQQYVPYTPPPTSSASGGAIPPPPKPLSLEDTQVTAFNAIIAAVKARAKANPALMKDPQLVKDFETFKNLTARAIRPGTPDEGVTAAMVALTRSLKLVFGTR